METDLQRIIEQKVTNGVGYISEDSYYSRKDKRDELNIQYNLGMREAGKLMEKIDELSLFEKMELDTLFSSLKIIEALKMNRKGKVYRTVEEVNAAMNQEFVDQQTIKKEKFREIYGEDAEDPDFVEWVAAGRDPLNYMPPW